MNAILTRAELSVIKLDLYGGTEPSEATRIRLARDLRDNLLWLTRVAQASTPADQYEDFGRTKAALDFITIWFHLMEHVTTRDIEHADEAARHLYETIASVHDECFGVSDAAEDRAADALRSIAQSFSLYASADELNHPGQPSTLISVVNARSVAAHVHTLRMPLETYLIVRS